MPPKRKASEIVDVSPSKRTALPRTNLVDQDSPSRQTTTPKTTPKVRRTYGRRLDEPPDALQEVVNAVPDCTNEKDDPKLDTGLTVSTPMKTSGRTKAETRDFPSKRRSKRIDLTEEPEPKPTEMPRRVKRTYTKRVIVEVPLPPPHPSLPLESSEPPVTPRKHKATTHATRSPPKSHSLLTAKQLPAPFHPCLNAQKKAILRTLHTPSELFQDKEESGNEKTAKRQLESLLQGTVTRSEGNSCLLLGPRGSGKSTILNQCLESLRVTPIIIRLSGWIHRTDRLAMREIAYQLGQQTGKSFLQVDEDEDDPFTEQDDNPFSDHPNSQAVETGLALPPPSHLPALISAIPTLSRPTVVILDAFDLFALHPRQALLYCLLDTVQGCRAGMDNKGLAVVGTTSRIDTINLLEKRVKSRFSGRVVRTTGISATADILSLAKRALCTPIPSADHYEDFVNEWNDAWSKRTAEYLNDKGVFDLTKDTVGIAKDTKLLFRVLVHAVAQLSPTSPFLTPSIHSQAIASQRSRPSLYDSLDLPYPVLCLLIASIHYITSGHDFFTFDMLFSTFRNQLRASMAAPVQVNGGSIGMVRCSRTILLSAFEHLICSRIFVAAAAPSNSMAKEFSRYRATLEREDVRKAVERTGQVALKKWLNKAD